MDKPHVSGGQLCTKRERTNVAVACVRFSTFHLVQPMTIRRHCLLLGCIERQTIGVLMTGRRGSVTQGNAERRRSGKLNRTAPTVLAKEQSGLGAPRPQVTDATPAQSE